MKEPLNFLNLKDSIQYGSIPLAIVSSLLLSNCAKLPQSFGGDSTAGINLPSNFETSSPKVEIVNSLSALFNLPKLNATVKQALLNNPDLKISVARLKEAGYNFNASKAPLLPTVDHNGSLGRTYRNSSGTGDYAQSFNARWEVDLWGRINASVKAANYSQAAAQFDLEAAKQSIAAQTMQAWFTLAQNDALLNLAERRKDSFQTTLDLLKKRFELGTTNLAEIELAKVDFQNSQFQLAQQSNARDISARAIHVLTGNYPTSRHATATFPLLTKTVAPNTPVSVLMRRPDLQAAYHRILAADSRVKVAHADQFPVFNLTSNLGTSATHLKDFAKSGFSTFSILGALSTPLIDNGQRKAELGASSARAEQAYYDYQRILLDALAEVENSLGNDSSLKQQQDSLQKALAASKSAEQRIKILFENGTVEILTYLDTQRRRFTNEEQLINIKCARYKNRVALALAIGTGI